MDERLERIKKDLTYLANSQNKIVTLGISDYEYVIQESEKAEELQDKINELIGSYKIAYSQNEHHRKLSEELQAKVEELEKQYSTRLGKFLKIQEENQRYKEALEEIREYVDSTNFDESYWDIFVINKIIDKGLKAEESTHD